MLISAASVEADVHPNSKIPANRSRINEAPRSKSGWVPLAQTAILCFNHDLMLRTAPSLGLIDQDESSSSRKNDSRAILQAGYMLPRRWRSQLQLCGSRVDPAPPLPTPDVPP